MKQHPTDFEPPLCSVDPITLTGLAIAGIAGIASGAAVSSMSHGDAAAPAAATPSAPPAAPAPQMQPAQTRPKPKSNTPSFIGGSAVPDSRSFGSKTLLGQ